ncbi:MAG: alpha/beta hydrolase [Gemmataceae bacterium]|nr:alpha/beta hydrolase [Gemmataceae bacterium]
MPTLSLSPRLALHYHDVNPQADRTVLLLHGLGANGSSWLPQFEALAGAGYRVLAPDLRGFGRSSYPGSTGIAEMARDAADMLASLTDGPVDVAGLSMGGIVALQLALDHRPLVRRLVLVNTCARLRPRHVSGWLTYLLRYLTLYVMGSEAQARLVARRTFPHEHQDTLRRYFAEQILEADAYAYRAALRALACFNAAARLADVRVPTLVLSGEHDRTIPLEMQRGLVEGIAGAQHIILPAGGHAMPADQPEAFNRAFLNFLLSETLTAAGASFSIPLQGSA